MFGTGAPNNSDGNAVDMRLRGVRNQLPTPNGFQPSVHNNSLENVTNDTPTVGLFPAKSQHVSLTAPNNSLLPMDFVFVLRERVGKTLHPPIINHPPHHRLYGQETSMVSLQRLNTLIMLEAQRNERSSSRIPDHWTSDLNRVTEYAQAFGVVNNLMALGSGGGYSSKDQDRTMVNVQVSRRANIKNNFYPADKRGTPQFQSFGMTQVCVQFSMEKADLGDTGQGEIDVVFASMVLLNDVCCSANDAYVRDANKKLKLFFGKGEQVEIAENSIKDFADKPIAHEYNRILVPIGRVLNPPMREPTQYEALQGCFDKAIYDRLKPIEVELGCD